MTRNEQILDMISEDIKQQESTNKPLEDRIDSLQADVTKMNDFLENMNEMFNKKVAEMHELFYKEENHPSPDNPSNPDDINPSVNPTTEDDI